MSDINQKLHEAMGLCAHDVEYLTWELYRCRKCLEERSAFPGNVPAYDSSLTDAFELVEFMRKEGWRVAMNSGPTGDEWFVAFTKNVYVETAFNESLPRAIALAAIKALENK